MMCLAVPAQIVSIDGLEGHADLHGNEIPICIALVPEAVAGDWVLIHAGFAIQRLDAQDAQQTWSVLSDLELRTTVDST
jgi:hydrogenase expression/formation protein HypC